MFALIMLGAIAYAASFQVPFYLDDTRFLTDPAFIRHAGLIAVWQSEPTRPLTYSTLYFNYLLGAEHPWGYHLVNLLIHLCTAATVFLLVRTLARTPNSGITPAGSSAQYEFAAVVAALIFVVHPLNTQAVTYIVQRAAILSAFFYLFSVFAYLKARLEPSGVGRAKWLAICAGAGICALLSKQIAATLPLSLLLVEFIFFWISRRTFAIIGGIVFLTLALAVVTIVSGGFSLEWLDRATRETTAITRTEYLSMQTQVLWHYVRLFFIPIGLCLEYDTPSANSWRDTPVILATIAHLATIGFALVFARKKPVPAFGVLFFYAASLVESSVFPITDVVFEHRTYLPNVGLCIVVGWMTNELYVRYQYWRTSLIFATAIVVITLSTMTFQRDLLWQDPIAFFSQNTQLEPESVRAWGNLGAAYIDRKDYTAAYGALRKIDVARLNDVTREKYFVNLITSLAGMNKAEEVIKLGRQLLETKMVDAPALRAVVLNAMAVSFVGLGYDVQAMDSLEDALRLDPDNKDVIRNYAYMKRRLEAAKERAGSASR